MSRIRAFGKRALTARLSAYMGGEAVFPVVVLFALNAVDWFDTRAFDVLGPEIAKSFHVGVGAFGAVTVLVLVLAPFVAVPVSYLSDRWKRMPLAIGGAVAWGAASLATGFAPTLALLVAFRVASGFGKTVNEPVHAALISEFYSPKGRAKAFGIHALAQTIGGAIAAVLAGLVAQYLGWRSAFFILAVPTFVTVVVALRLHEPPRGRFEVIETPAAPPLRPTVRRIWAIRSLRHMFIGLAFINGSTLGIGVLVPFFLKEDFGVQPGLRGVLLGIGTALSAVAVIVGTAVAQERINVRPSDGMRLLCWSAVVAGGALAILALAPTLALAIVLIWVILIVFAFVLPGLFSIITMVSPPEIRASAFALGSLIALAGTGFSLVGFVLGDKVSMRLAIGVMAPIFMRGVLYFFKAATFVDDDVERLDPAHALKARSTAGEESVLLETKGLTVSYSGVRVLFGLDLEIRRGEVVALLGTNGAGKSTALNAISGIVEPDGGNVWFQGEPIVGESPEQTVRRGIVQVPGGRGVFPGLTVEENLRMGAFLIRHDRALFQERLDDVLRLFPRLAERRGQRAGSLSGGERQMLTLATSFLLHPTLLLIDELSLGLAPALVSELLEAVRAMNARGTTIVIVEQSVNIALNLASRAYFLEKGEVRFSGPTAELLKRRDLLRSVFLEGAGARAGRSTVPPRA